MTKLVQLADIHFGAESQHALDATRAMLDVLKPDAVVVCGDLTQRGKRSEFADSLAWMKSLGVPFMAVEGNHDTPLLNIYERVAGAFDRYDEHFSDWSGTLDSGHTKVVGLNTSRGWQVRKNWAEGSVNLDDLEAAIAEVEAADITHGILICHHPFLSPPEAPLRTATRRGTRANNRLARSKIDLLLTGHVHAPSVVRQTGHNGDGAYLSVTAGTLSVRIRSDPPSFNLIELSDEDIRITAFMLHGESFQPRETEIWKTGSLEPVSTRHMKAKL